MCTPVINSIYSQYTYFLSVLNLECTGKSTFTSWVTWKVENGLQKQWFVHQHLKDKMSFDKYYWKRNIQCKLNFHLTWTATENNPLPSHHHSVVDPYEYFEFYTRFFSLSIKDPEVSLPFWPLEKLTALIYNSVIIYNLSFLTISWNQIVIFLSFFPLRETPLRE